MVNSNKDQKFFVYALVDPTKKSVVYKLNGIGDFKFDGEPYYIGKGKGKRPYHHLTNYRINKEIHTPKAQRTKKIIESGNKPIIQYIYEGVSEDKAFDLESECILSIGLIKYKTGTLTNLTTGGQGYGGRGGYLHKLSKEIHRYCPNGKYLSSHGSINEASEFIGINSRQSITRSANLNDGTITSGFAWSYQKKDFIKTSNKEKLFYIPHNVPSSKNSKQWTGKYLVNSKQVNSYIKKTQEYWSFNREIFIKKLSKYKKPYKIGFYFIRDSKRKYDWVNPLQTVQDLMVKYRWIEDDNTSIMYPFSFSYMNKREHYSKEGGVIIKILNNTYKISEDNE